MDILSPVGIVVIAMLVVVFANFISKILKVLFYVLLLVFVAVVFFGISYNDLISWASGILLWVF
ncbi:hypothetical protein HON71_01545 [Candidatus Woesearchaeota archaeon]|jgi:hypothetical protein|nr:hypothetical protein [Candidatus Woesearchaeota archaeon]MBT5342766.1 hypothetical protein [Candidatus Woesearchaeota archaeon]